MATHTEATDTDSHAYELDVPERLPYMPGLDGLRAIAVALVLLYHADVPWVRGGYLGVEVFLVISGYLITSLLLLEYRRNHRIDVKRFWMRRARRLLPAVFLLLLVVSAYSMVAARDAVYRLGRDAVAALGYATNWYLIGTEDSYFEAFGRPPLLQHLWSLSVEEQFYVVWPVLLFGGLALLGWRTARRRAAWRMLGLIVIAVGVSTALMWRWFVPFEDPSRIYYGTDTRAAGLLIGAALAFLWQPWRFRGTLGRRGRWALNAIGFGALVALVGLNITTSEFGPFLYQGGFLVVGLTTAAVIAVTVHPAAALGGTLSGQTLRWIGTRSYGIYLWHWPIFAVTRPGVDLALDGVSIFVLRLTATAILAEMSYRLVETPIRRLGFRGWWLGVASRLRLSPIQARIASAAAAAGVALLAVGLVAGADSFAGAESIIASPASDGEPIVIVTTTVDRLPEASQTREPTDEPAPTTSTDSATAPASPSSEAPTASADQVGPATVADLDPAGPPERLVVEVEPVDAADSAPGTVLFIGDSVMLGAENTVRTVMGEHIIFDAVVSRQMKHVPTMLEAALFERPDVGAVVIHLGTNGAFSSDTFDDVMAELGDVDQVLFVNARVPRRWEDVVNTAISDGTDRWANATMIDWHNIALAHPEWFQEDRVHLNDEGRTPYADLIASHLEPDG